MVDGVERGALVGRQVELARLKSALDAAAGGQGRTVILGGEAGIGKSRLLEALAAEASGRGGVVLTGACLPLATGSMPYAPFVEWLRTLARTLEPARLTNVLGPARREIGRLVPEMAPREDVEDRSVEPDRTGRGRMFESILAVVERVARSGTTLSAVEDVQWADDETRALISFLSRNLRDAPVLLVLTIRTDDLEGASPTARWLAELEREEWVDRIELEPMDRADVVAMVRLLRADPPAREVVDSIIARSGGNPFFVEQLTEATVDTGRGLPPGLRDILKARLAEFPESTQRILRAAAAAGRRVDDDILAAVLDLSPSSVADAMRRPLTSAILVDAHGEDDGRGGYAFRHALLAEVAYAELLHGERDRLHAAFGLELQRRGAIGGIPVTAAELAHHWVLAREHERALPALIEAGRAAEHVYAFGEARRHYELALELWDGSTPGPDGTDRVALLQRAAECAVLSGAYERAVALGREALTTEELAQTVDGTTDPARLGALHERLRWFLWEAGDRDAAERELGNALRLIPTSPPSQARARALGQAAGLRLFGRDPDEAGRLAREAVDVARAAGALSEEAFALGILGWSEAVTGEVDRGIATYREALELAERLGGVEGIALGHANLAALLDQVGRSEASLDAALEGFAIARRLGVTRTYGGGLLGDAAKALFDLGRWPEAAAMADQGLGLDPLGLAATWLHVNRARVDTNTGRFEDAEEHLRRAGSLAPFGLARYRGSLLAAAAELAATRGRLDDARAALDQVVGQQSGAMPLDPAIGWLVWHSLRAEADAATVARARDDDVGMATIAARVEAIAGQLTTAAGVRGFGDSAHARGVVGLSLGEVGRVMGTSDPAAWMALAEGWEALGRPALVAYARLRFAEATLGQRGDRSVAAAALRAAHASAVRLGAQPLRREIEQLGRQARIELAEEATATESDPMAALGLTEREAEVIRHVAAGRSNQQIADALFITRKTASVHVSNILGKLGVANRVEAAAVAQRLGLVGDEDDR